MSISMQAVDLEIGYKNGKNHKSIFSGLNFSLLPGELVCLIGPNGIGKSTLLRTLAGVQAPLSGKVLMDGQSIHQLTPIELARKISLVLTDKINVGNLRVHELVALGRYPFTNWTGHLTERDFEVVDHIIQLIGIGYLANQTVHTLSDGQLQKVMIARALVQDGDLLILDEPTAHLDIMNKVSVMKTLRKIAHETQKTILLASHEIELTLQVADKLWLLDCNRPFTQGVPEDLILKGALSAMFDKEDFSFDMNSGRFKFSQPASIPIQVQGEGLVRAWTLHALEKYGYYHSEGANVRIQYLPHSKKWLMEQKGQTKELDTIENLLLYLKHNLPLSK